MLKVRGTGNQQRVPPVGATFKVEERNVENGDI